MLVTRKPAKALTGLCSIHVGSWTFFGCPSSMLVAGHHELRMDGACERLGEASPAAISLPSRTITPSA
eukprot:scaffold619086_cov15-Prasinocladus_malaysianus.AAC.1